jgi:hypothetical protein
MSQNPFRQGGNTNPGDQVYFDGKAIGGGGSATGPSGDHIMAFDATTMTGSPAYAAFNAQLAKSLEQREAQMLDAVSTEFAKSERRILALEKALAVAQTEVENAIRTATVGFIGEDETDAATKTVQKSMAETPEKYS